MNSITKELPTLRNGRMTLELGTGGGATMSSSTTPTALTTPMSRVEP
jgi:hypothetical protein